MIDRGYTLHEHLDEFGLINMNGRMYDPSLGTFLSPDPMISNPNSWLDYNRYSYAWGNPLKYCDPTGMSETEGEKTRKREESKHIPTTEEYVKQCYYNTEVGQKKTYTLTENGFVDQNGNNLCGVPATNADLKKFDNASDNTSYNTATSTAKNTSANQQQKMTTITPDDLNKPKDTGNWTENVGTAVDAVNNNKYYGTAMAMNGEMAVVREVAKRGGYAVLKGTKVVGGVGTIFSFVNDGYEIYNGTYDARTLVDIGVNATLLLISFSNPITAATLGTIYCIYTLTEDK